MFGAKGRKEKTTPKKTHVRKNDEVVVLAGKDRGKQGKVLRVVASKGTAVVERVNFMKKHTKKNPGKNQQGGVLEREAPIRVDNLQVVCPACSKPTRVGSKQTDKGLARVCRKCEAELG